LKERTHRLRVFLSGPIDGVLRDEASAWRQRASRHLWEAGFDVYDPTRVMQGPEVYRASPKEVFTNDSWNLSRSDIVLVNLDLPETIRSQDGPFFTIGEMFLAHRAGLPIVTFGHCFRGRQGYEAIVTRACDSLEDALQYIVDTYGESQRGA
jgi:hypothetical protein